MKLHLKLKSLRSVTILMMLLISFHVSAQNPQVDSLKLILKDLKEDSTKVNTLNDIAALLYGSDADEAIIYGSEANSTQDNSGITVSNTGGGQSHNNMPPFLSMRYIIATVGLFPSRN